MNRIIELILADDFARAKLEMEKLSEKGIEDVLLSYLFDSANLKVYTFLCCMAQQDCTAVWHYLASLVMSQPLCHLPGAYESAYYHAVQATESDREDVSLLEYLLFFNAIPDRLLSKEEADRVARRILKVQPDNATARQHLKDDPSP